MSFNCRLKQFQGSIIPQVVSQFYFFQFFSFIHMKYGVRNARKLQRVELFGDDRIHSFAPNVFIFCIHRRCQQCNVVDDCRC